MPRTNTSFKPGVSGNPGGRPRAALDVQALARECTPLAIGALIKALDSPRERVPAAVALLNRGWGLPKQTIETDAVSDVGLHLVAARLVSQQILEARAEPAPQAAAIEGELFGQKPPFE